MAKSVLQYVQACLSGMDSDLVDEINDTHESEQVAELLKEVYYNLINRQEWDFLWRPVQLTAAGDTSSPTKFTLETATRYIELIEYDVSDSGDATALREIQWLPPYDFLARLGTDGDDRTFVTAGNQLGFYVTTNKQPTFWTTFNDQDIYFDAYDSDVESTLVTSKIYCRGVVVPDFTVEDNFTPDIPLHMEQLLQSELNAAAHLYFKQQQSVYDERQRITQAAKARRNQSRTRRENYYAFSAGR